MSNVTAPAAPVDIPVSRDTLLLIGPVFFGALASFWLFGISVMQIYVYYINFPQDSKLIKTSVYTIFLLDVFQSICVAGFGWKNLCWGWGREEALLTLNWSLYGIPVVSGIVSAWVQTFYAWRIFKFARWKILPTFIILVALAQCAAATGVTIIIPSETVLQLHGQYKVTTVWLGGAALADIIIAVSMLYILFTARQNTLQTTQRVINSLICLTIETGVATATCAILELVLYLVFSTNNLHLFFATVLCKVYSNAFMTSLNSRTTHKIEDTSTETSTGGQYNNFNSPFKRDPMVVHVSTAMDEFEAAKQSTETFKQNELHSDVDGDTLRPPSLAESP